MDENPWERRLEILEMDGSNLVVDDALGEHLAREREVVHHHLQLPPHHL